MAADDNEAIRARMQQLEEGEAEQNDVLANMLQQQQQLGQLMLLIREHQLNHEPQRGNARANDVRGGGVEGGGVGGGVAGGGGVGGGGAGVGDAPQQQEQGRCDIFKNISHAVPNTCPLLLFYILALPPTLLHT